MKVRELGAWLKSLPKPVPPAFTRVAALLSRAAGPGAASNVFEGAVDSACGLEGLGLAHIHFDAPEPDPALARRRGEAKLEAAARAFALVNGAHRCAFSERSFEALRRGALSAAAVAAHPFFGMDWDLRGGEPRKLTLYFKAEDEDVLAAASAALGLRLERSARSRLLRDQECLGADFFPDGRAALKAFHSFEPGRRPRLGRAGERLFGELVRSSGVVKVGYREGIGPDGRYTGGRKLGFRLFDGTSPSRLAGLASLRGYRPFLAALEGPLRPQMIYYVCLAETSLELLFRSTPPSWRAGGRAEAA